MNKQHEIERLQDEVLMLTYLLKDHIRIYQAEEAWSVEEKVEKIFNRMVEDYWKNYPKNVTSIDFQQLIKR